MTWKDPHYGRELELLRAGIKRLAYLIAGQRSDQHDFREFEIRPYRGNRLVYRNEDGNLADDWESVYSAWERREITLAQAHERCGELLGYDKKDISHFLSSRGDDTLR